MTTSRAPLAGCHKGGVTLARAHDTPGVFVIDLGDGENLIDPRFLTELNHLLDEVEKMAAPRAVVTHGSGRLYCSGLDLGWMAANPDGLPRLVADMHELFARLLAFPAPTVAALNGHAFAGGAMLALAHDYRVMRADRGYFCLPEIDGGIGFTPGLCDLIAARLGPPLAHKAMTSGCRYAAVDGVGLGMIDEAVPGAEVLPSAIKRAAALAEKDPATYGQIKTQLHRDALASLRDDVANAVEPAHFGQALSALAAKRSRPARTSSAPPRSGCAGDARAHR